MMHCESCSTDKPMGDMVQLSSADWLCRDCAVEMCSGFNVCVRYTDGTIHTTAQFAKYSDALGMIKEAVNNPPENARMVFVEGYFIDDCGIITTDPLVIWTRY